MTLETYPRPNSPSPFRTNSAMSKSKNEAMNDNGSWTPYELISLKILGGRLGPYEEDRYDGEQHNNLALSGSICRLLSLSSSL